MIQSQTAVLMMQAMLRTQQPITVDGVPGPMTAQAFSTSSPDLQSTIKVTLMEQGFSVDNLLQPKFDSKNDTSGWVSRDELTALIMAELARNIYRPQVTLPLMLYFADIESSRRKVDGVWMYDPKSKNGSHFGFYQFDKESWDTAAIWQRTNNTDGEGLAPFTEVCDPKQNVRAAMSYCQVNSYALEKAGLPITAETLYACHQRGVAGFKRLVAKPSLLKTDATVTGQSDPSEVILKTAVNQALAVS